jgi:membrane-bound ClpP family serine protease
MTLTVVILIFMFGLGFIFLEVFIPGGVIGVLGALMVTGAVIAAYIEHGVIPGTVLLALSLIVGVVFIRTGLKRFELTETQRREDGHVAVESGLDDLLGKQGYVQSVLRPVGIARIDENPVDVVTRGEMIQPGIIIEVIHVEGNRVVVRAAKT